VSCVTLTLTVQLLKLSGVNSCGIGHLNYGVQLPMLKNQLLHLTFLSWVLTMLILLLLKEISKLVSLKCLLLLVVKVIL
jgi:hypothetical protein